MGHGVLLLAAHVSIALLRETPRQTLPRRWSRRRLWYVEPKSPNVAANGESQMTAKSTTGKTKVKAKITTAAIRLTELAEPLPASGEVDGGSRVQSG